MHREQLSHTIFTPHTNFLVTASIDGIIKFWKKDFGGVEFVKEFKVHDGDIKSISVSADGRSMATAGAEQVAIWDVLSFDLVALVPMSAAPRCVCWVHGRNASLPLLAVSLDGDPNMYIYDGRGENQTPIETLKIHRQTVTNMAFNSQYDCVVSCDEGGMLEYWSPSSGYEKPENVFKMKSSTNLFEFKKSKSTPTSITISPTGQYFATFSFPDRKVRVFDFASGKLHRTYDESIETITDMQQAGTAAAKLEDAEFNRRIAVERDLDHPRVRNYINIPFDETGNFILYGSVLGIKVVNLLTNRVVKLYGKDETFRALNIGLYQGAPDQKRVVTIEMAASENPLLQEAEARDAMLINTAVGRVRFYMFTNETEASKSTRDIQNEKPLNAAQRRKQEEEKQKAELSTQAIIHTTYGDIHVRLFPTGAPKAVENFTTHAKNGYYNDVIFHRVIRKFMIQTGDPLGDGTGGESIWGKEFADEFESNNQLGLRHDKPYILSMANAGPNTNGSQFFITTEKAPWLDGKHTIFGKATQGFDVVHAIENTKVYKEKPRDDIKIVSISIS